MAKGKKGIGIIGYGGFGEFIRKAWDEMDEVHVVAACDSDPARAPSEGLTFCLNVDDILANPNVEIVSIATPPSSHKELAIRALRAGKHVLVEKPLALTAEDGELIKRVAAENNRVVTVDFVLRYNPLVEMLHEIVESEIFGKLRRVDLRNYAMQDTVPEGHWFWKPEVSGRILLEHGVHFFDLASWMVGAKAADTWSLGVERKPGVEDRVFAAVKYENDVVGTFWHSFSRPRELETTSFHFAFDLGEIDMGGWIPLELGIWGWTNEEGMEKLESLLEGADVVADPIEPQKAHSSEFQYDVEYEVNTEVELEEPKLDVYADNIRAIMSDFVQAIDDPSHNMRVTIDDAIEAVRVAEKATNFAHPK
ncbi:MAG: Gfo/Idh/MocA family oxidoreductase [Armatimonadetes bacterium]|nr:Gfo/Idh/MocA family oxidoreductase [Armatimonadota bacterium]